MKRLQCGLCFRSVLWLIGAGFCIVSLVGASFVSTAYSPRIQGQDLRANLILDDLQRLSLLQRVPETTIEDLLRYQRQSGKTLVQIIKDLIWLKRLGLSRSTFKATWYMANPFDVLPLDLQIALKRTKTPIRTDRELWKWCKSHNAPLHWHKALKGALIETTSHNLWRASQGLRPYANNGQYLEPIVVEKGPNLMDIHDGHIATDPRVIPTNSMVLLLVRIQGKERILRVKAADIGVAIKGRHVDLPIHLSAPGKAKLPYTLFPKEHLRNVTVEILAPVSSRDRKA